VDGRGLQEVQINDKFAKLAEALFVAERTARHEVDARVRLKKTLAKKQKETQEEKLRAMAAQAHKMGQRKDDDEDEDEDEAVTESEQAVAERDEREELRKDRKRELRRELRMEQIKADKQGRGFAAREAERDISEQIALGKPTKKSKDMMFDQRLFNQDEGTAQGFGAEDAYSAYDKPLFNKGNQATYIYRAKPGDDEQYGEVQKMIEKSTKKFTSETKGFKGFDGAEQQATTAGNRSKPVEFEKSSEDPFGLDHVTTDRKKRDTLDKIGSKGGMAAHAGGSTLDREQGLSQREAPKFVEGGGSKRSRSRSRGRDRDRDRDRRRSRSRSRSRDREKRRRH